MKRYRVAHVITRLCKGGAQENTFHTVRLADRSKYEVDLISGYTVGAEGSIEDDIQRAGISIIREPNLVRDVAPWRDWLALQSLAKLFHEKHYHIVHTHTSKAGYIGRLAAARAHTPVIIHTPHGHIFDGYFSKPVTTVFKMMERHAARHSDRLIALTTRGVREHLDQGVGKPEQWLPIFSGIDCSPYEWAISERDATRASLGVTPNQVLIGSVGRLEPVKGIAYFVEAAHRVAGQIAEARFIVVGDGSQRDSLERLARPLADRLQFLGLRRDIPALMAALDVFVLPSINEGMGRVLLEAGAAATSCVATAVGGVPDIVVDGKTGLLTPPRDIEAMAQAIIRLARDPEFRTAMGLAARAFVVPDYSLESMVRQIESCYARLLEEKHVEP